MGSNAVIPPLPQGFTLDQPAQSQAAAPNIPPPPAGFTVDQPQQAAKASPVADEAHAEISARKGGAYEWLQDLESDIREGSNATAVGRFLHKIGMQPTTAGVAPGAEETVASPVNGPVHVAQGLANRNLVQGTKQIVKGGLETATLPSAFIAPEGAEAAAAGLEKGTAAAGEVASKVGTAAKEAVGALKKSSVQPALQNSIRETMNAVAEESGVAKPAAKSIGKTTEELADNVYSKSKGLYKTIDEATGGRVQRFSDRLKNIQRQLDNLTGTEEDIQKESSLMKAQKETEEAMQDAFADAKANGVDPKVVDEATQAFKKSQALYDLNRQVRMARSGASPDVVEAAAAAKNPEVLDAEKLFKRIDQMHGNGRLQEALGDAKADALYKKVNDALLQARKVMRNQKIAKGAAKAAAAGIGIGGIKRLIE